MLRRLSEWRQDGTLNLLARLIGASFICPVCLALVVVVVVELYKELRGTL